MPGGGHSPEFDFDETKPAGTTVVADGDNWNRSNQMHIDNALAIEHYAPSNDPDASEDDFGRHDYISLKEQSAKPDLSGSSNRHALYAKNDGRLYLEDESENEILVMGFVGEVRMILGTTVPTGWLALDGDSIGNTGSGADHTGSAYESLYTHLWDELSDSEFPIAGGRGASAAADWAALKKGTMPDARSRMPIGAGQGSGLSSRTIGDEGGGETKDLQHQHAAGTLAGPSHTHPVGTYSMAGSGSTDKGLTSGGMNIAPVHDHNLTGSSGGGGTGAVTGNTANELTTSEDVMNPWIALTMIIKL